MIVPNKILKIKNIAIVLAIMVILSSLFSINAVAGELIEVNNETGYDLFVEDKANLFTEEQIDILMDALLDLSYFGHAGVITLVKNPYNDTEKYAYEFMIQNYRYQNAAMLVIDMDTRTLTVWGNGDIQARIERFGTTITDNIYEYASAGEYYACAYEAIEEMYTVLHGEKIAQPMKYLSNACLAILLSLILSYFIARKTSSTSKATNRETMQGLFTSFKLENQRAHRTFTTREYSPRESSSGGSSGSSGGGGGGGGGGGSHGF